MKMKMQMQSDSTAKLVAAGSTFLVLALAYQTKMRSLKTDQAREAFRLEHHEEMKIRAAARGVTLPNEPPAKGLGIQGNAPQGAVQGGATGKTGGMGSATGGGASAGSGSGAGPGAGGGGGGGRK